MQICSDIVLIDKPEIVSTEIIENVFNKQVRFYNSLGCN